MAPGLETKDPDNILLSRMPMRRMDADALYDSILKVTGRLFKFHCVRTSLSNRCQTGWRGHSRDSDKGYRRALYVLQQHGRL